MTASQRATRSFLSPPHSPVVGIGAPATETHVAGLTKWSNRHGAGGIPIGHFGM